MSPLPLSLYRGFAYWPGPWLARRLLARRAARGKEDWTRLEERFGHTSHARPAGETIWFHAASVGECLSLLPLLEALRQRRPDLTPVVTSGTVTSAKMMATRLPKGAVHQFAPIDTIESVRRFLDHWRPSLLGVVESEIWPTMLFEARARGLRTALISARLSEKSTRSWGYAPRSIGALLGVFDVILAQDETAATRFRSIGAPAERLSVTGSLKRAAGPLPVSESELAIWAERLGARPLWLLASTHPGDEIAAIEAQATLARRARESGFPPPLTVIAPRHPERGDDVAALLSDQGPVARRSRGETPGPRDPFYLVDVLGELGLWFRLAPVVFLGGSLTPEIGGHNPLEPGRVGAAALFGPYTESVEIDCARLIEGGAARRIDMRDGGAPGVALGAALADLLAPSGAPTDLARRIGARALAMTQEDRGVLDHVLAAIEPLLPTAPCTETSDARA